MSAAGIWSMQSDQFLQQVAAVGLLPPRALTVAITSECNLNCEHCWLECSLPGAGASPVPVNTLKELVRQFIALAGEELCLTGGEPMTHPDWLELIQFCCRQPEVRCVVVQTNATLLDAGTVKDLAQNGLGKLSFQVSLDGCSATTHDLIRGHGSLQRAIQGLQALVAAGFGSRTTIAFTEMRHNFHEVPQLLETAEQLGVAAVIGLPLVPCGSAERNPLTNLPTAEQYLALLERFASDAELRRRYRRLGRFSAIEWAKGAAASSHLGCRFLEKPYLSARGLLYPCALLQVDGYAGRDVYERSLGAAILTVLPLWADLQRVSQARTTDLDCLTPCSGGRHCGGGCLARAYLPDRNLSAREDRCELRRAVYAWSASSKIHGEW